MEDRNLLVCTLKVEVTTAIAYTVGYVSSGALPGRDMELPGYFPSSEDLGIATDDSDVACFDGTHLRDVGISLLHD